MSGEVSARGEAARDIPYQLRPNKFIDRQMFIEALSRLIHAIGPERYIYVSMGGRHLVDHYAVYNDLGIKAQVAFDNDENTVKRQKFNRPTDTTVCELMSAADLPSALDSIAGRFKSKQNFIIWLDYTGTDWKAQLQEAEQILIRLRHGDVFRITMNADTRTLKRGAGTEDERASKRAEDLRSRIGDLMPTAIDGISDDSFPKVLAECVGLVAQRAQSQVSSLSFVPVLSTSYSDGTRMLTVTCTVSDPTLTGPKQFPCSAFGRWPFASKNKKWNDIHEISVPILSVKERFKLDVNLKKSAKKMLATLKFLPAADELTSITVVESYKRFQRFYPAFRHVDD